MSKSVRWFLVFAAGLFVVNLFLVSMLTRGRGIGSLGGLAIGETAPAIEADGWLIGDAPAAADLDGKVRVVVAWAYW
jgi:hypothetical protein